MLTSIRYRATGLRWVSSAYEVNRAELVAISAFDAGQTPSGLEIRRATSAFGQAVRFLYCQQPPVRCAQCVAHARDQSVELRNREHLNWLDLKRDERQ